MERWKTLYLRNGTSKIFGILKKHEKISLYEATGKSVIRIDSFFKRFELLDDTVGVFGIVFRHLRFSAGGIKEKHRGFFRINSLTDRLAQVNKPVKEGL